MNFETRYRTKHFLWKKFNNIFKNAFIYIEISKYDKSQLFKLRQNFDYQVVYF